MKQLALLFLISIFFLNTLSAQATWIKNKKEYKLVNNKQLDETINEIYYYPPNEIGIRKPGIILKNSINGKKEISNNIIVNYNNEKIIKSDLKPSSFYVSDNLEYFGREVMIKRSTQDEPGENVFELYKLDGTKLFEMKVETDYEYKLWDFKILNNGYVLMIDHMGGIIKVYDQGDRLIKEKDFLIGMGFDRNRGFNIKDTKDSRYIALQATDTDTINYSINYVNSYLLDIDLNILFKRELLYPRMSEINVSNDGNTIISSCADRSLNKKNYKSYIFNISELKFLEIEGFFTSKSSFYSVYEDDDIVILFDPQKGLKLFYIPGQTELFNHKGSILQYAYDYAPKTELVFILKGYSTGHRRSHPEGRFENVKLKILNLDGTPVSTLNLGTVDYKSRGRCFVSCTNDASEFILKVGDNIYTYEEVK